MDRQRDRLRLGLFFCFISIAAAYPQFQNEIYRKRLPSFLTATKTQTRRSSDYGPPAHVPVYLNPYPEVPEELPHPKHGNPSPPGTDSYQKIVLGDQNPSNSKYHDEPQEVTEGPIPPPTPSAPKSRLDEIARQVQKLLLDSQGHVDTNKIPEPVKKPGSKAPGFSPNRRNIAHRIEPRNSLPSIQKSGYDAESPKTKTNGGITIHSSGYNFDGAELPNSAEEGTSTVASTYEDRKDSKQNGYDDDNKHRGPDRGNIDEGENNGYGTKTTKKPQKPQKQNNNNGYDQYRPTTPDYYPYRQKGYRQTTTRATPKTTQTPRTTTRARGEYDEQTTVASKNNGYDYSNRNTVAPKNNGYDYGAKTAAPKRNEYDEQTTVTPNGYDVSEKNNKNNGYDENPTEQQKPKEKGYGDEEANGYEKPKEDVTPPSTYEQEQPETTTASTNEDNGYDQGQGNKNEHPTNENGYEESHKVNAYDMLVEHSGDQQAEGYHNLLARDAKAYVEEHKRLQRAMAKRIYAEIRKQIKRELDLGSTIGSSSAKETSTEKLSDSSEQLKEAQHEEPYSSAKSENNNHENNGYDQGKPNNQDNGGYEQPKDSGDDEIHEAHPVPPKGYLENIEESEHPIPSTQRPIITPVTPHPDVKKLVNNFAKQSENQAKATRHQTGYKSRPQASTTPKDFGFDGSVDRVTTPLPYGYDNDVPAASPVPPVDLYGENQETTTEAPAPEPSTQGYENGDDQVHEAKPLPPADLYGNQETITSTPESPNGDDQYTNDNKEKIDEGENNGYEGPGDKENNGQSGYEGPGDKDNGNSGYEGPGEKENNGQNGYDGPGNKDNNPHNEYEEPNDDDHKNGYENEHEHPEKGKNNGYDNIPEDISNGYPGDDKNQHKDVGETEDIGNGYPGDGKDQNKDSGEKPEYRGNGYPGDGQEQSKDDGDNGYGPGKDGNDGNDDDKNKGDSHGDIVQGYGDDEDKDHKKDKHKLGGPPGIEPPGGDADHQPQEQHISYTETEDGDEGDNQGNSGNYGGYSAQPAEASGNKWTRGHRRELVVTQKIRSAGKQKQRVFIDYEKGGRPQIYAKQDQDASKSSSSSSESKEDDRRVKARAASRYVPFNQVRHLFL